MSPMPERASQDVAQEVSNKARERQLEIARTEGRTLYDLVLNAAKAAVGGLNPDLVRRIHSPSRRHEFVWFTNNSLFPIMELEEGGGAPSLVVVLADGHVHRYKYANEHNFSISAWSLSTAQESQGTLALPIVGDVGPDDEIVFVDGQAFWVNKVGQSVPICIPDSRRQYAAGIVTMPQSPSDKTPAQTLVEYQRAVRDLTRKLVETFGVS